MPGTKAGGLKAAATNKLRYGEDFFAKIGSKGGKNGTTGGFAANIPCTCAEFSKEHLLRECAGRRGGLKSRRGKQIVEPVGYPHVAREEAYVNR